MPAPQPQSATIERQRATPATALGAADNPARAQDFVAPQLLSRAGQHGIAQHLMVHTAMAAANDNAALDDQVLAARFRDGDRQAFAELVRRHQRTVFHAAWRYVRNEEDAKDLTQATFVKAWQNAAQFRGDANIKTWLYRIAVNLALNWVRDHGKYRGDELREDQHAAPDSPSAHLDEAETSAQLRQAVETLPAKQRMVVELRVHDGLSFREIAEVADCTEDAAKANFHHGLKRLKGLLRAVQG